MHGLLQQGRLIELWQLRAGMGLTAKAWAKAKIWQVLIVRADGQQCFCWMDTLYRMPLAELKANAAY